MDAKNKLNIILDIDETLVYFIHQRYFKNSWCKLGNDEKKKYEIVESKSGIFLRRPHLETFLDWIFKHCNVFLWTWSDIDYAEGVAKMLGKTFKGILADEDANASSSGHGNSKDLNYLWYPEAFCEANKKKIADMGTFHECNTILIDDLPGNSVNTSNFKNSITVNPFGIFGEVKDRSDEYEDLSTDKTLLDVLEIIKKVHCYLQKNPPDDDSMYKNVFCPSNIKSMGLSKYVKHIRKKCGTVVRAIGVGKSIHFVEGTGKCGAVVAEGGRTYHKTAKKYNKTGRNIYVGSRGGKYIMSGGGKFTKVKGQGRVRASE